MNLSISRSNFKRNNLSFGFLSAANKNPSRPVLKSISLKFALCSGVNSISRFGDDELDLQGVCVKSIEEIRVLFPTLVCGLLLLTAVFGFRFNSTIFFTSAVALGIV